MRTAANPEHHHLPSTIEVVEKPSSGLFKLPLRKATQENFRLMIQIMVQRSYARQEIWQSQ
jgi:hypothetical protein